MDGEIIGANVVNSDYTILIVDDVTSNVLLLKILLKNEKFNVLTASNGHQCVEISKQQHPDLILLDVMMPDITGFDTAVILKKDPETSDIPIIFMTALSSPSDLVKGFKSGGNDYITKPFNKDELVIRVRHQISLVAAKRMIQEKNIELQRTLQGRDKLYSVIAHDLRSPMSTIKITLNMLTMMLPAEMIGAENAELLKQTNEQTEEIFSLLDNLLKWTKSQTGRLNVVYQNFDVNDIIPGVIDIFQMVAQNKDITLAYDQPRNIIVHADQDMLKTVLRNFLSNAIKFSQKDSSIEILVSETEDGKFAKISVRDHGTGISEENQRKLFHSDTHYTTYGTNNESGSGLGLLLCKDFAEKNGGSIELVSAEGQGSTFSILVPVHYEGDEAYDNQIVNTEDREFNK